MLFAKIIVLVFSIIGVIQGIADGCIWGRAREKIYGELKEPDCYNSMDCNHEHEIVEQQLFNNEMMLTSESGGTGQRDKRFLEWNGGAVEQKRAPIHLLQPSFDPDLIERDKRETHGGFVHSDRSHEDEKTYPAASRSTRSLQ
ncbi:uncharacterized protein LOC111056599 [Nilaparvata lugens]|uniref:uncharacterized protein LOC111056599 n=1 Tax=Nilaparvata lugens TaxID=108931 RepID=UPI00193CA58C|nr:uncharacterized protein LOC111056599 [Nilaparvata lugens]